jgi:hypothetical protein
MMSLSNKNNDVYDDGLLLLLPLFTEKKHS